MQEREGMNSKGGILLLNTSDRDVHIPFDLIRDPMPERFRFMWIMLKSFCHINPAAKNYSFTWVSMEKVAKCIGISVVTAFGRIKALREMAWLTTIRRGLGKTNIYILHAKKGERIPVAKKREYKRAADERIMDYFNRQ